MPINPCTGARGATPHWTCIAANPPGHASPPGTQGTGGKRSLPAGWPVPPIYQSDQLRTREGYRVKSFASGGVDSASLIATGGIQYVYSGGAAHSDTVASGGEQYDHGLTVSTTVSRGGTETVLSGGSEDYSQVYGAELISSGGRGYGDTIYSGGQLTVFDGGVDSGSSVESGGEVFVSSGGGYTSDTTIHAGGAETIPGGIEYDSLIYGSEVASSGGNAVSDTVESGGSEVVSSGGLAESLTILLGARRGCFRAAPSGRHSEVCGNELISRGGSGYRDVVTSGPYASGQLTVFAGGVESSSYVEGGGRLVVSDGGYEYSSLIYGSEFVSAGGSTLFDTVENGGLQDLQLQGFADDTTVLLGGAELVVGSEDASQVYGRESINGGSGYSDTVHGGGVLTVSHGGVDSSSLVESGGKAVVSSGGVDRSSVVNSGGNAVVSSGGVDSSSVVKSGGKAVVSSGGVFAGGTVDGSLTVSSGGVVSGGLTISGGGTANVSGTVAAGHVVSFTGAGDLALYNQAHFQATIGSFKTGDEFDLGGFVYSAS